MSEARRNRIISEITTFLASLDGDDRHAPATLVFNEGWMLRLVLAAAAGGIQCLPTPLGTGARWFSEARLYTPFSARKQGDQLAESVTHADGVIGHFDIGRSSRAGLHLTPAATHFVVLEAKMFSGLSAGTTRAHGYDQAARNVACLAWAVSSAKRPVNQYQYLGFWVLAPEEQIRRDVFACATRMSIEQKIRARVAEYDEEWRSTLDGWLTDWLLPVLERLKIVCVSWEQVINNVLKADAEFGTELRGFYERCVHYNRIERAGRVPRL